MWQYGLCDDEERVNVTIINMMAITNGPIATKNNSITLVSCGVCRTL